MSRAKTEADYANSFRIVEGFYDDPDEVRNFAIRSSYKKPLISATPSLISDVRHPDTWETLARIAALVDCEPDWELIDALYAFWGESSCGEFQLTLRHLNRTGRPHSHKNGEWVGIVYLNTYEQCRGKLVLTYYDISRRVCAILRKLPEGNIIDLSSMPTMRANGVSSHLLRCDTIVFFFSIAATFTRIPLASVIRRQTAV